MTDQPSSNTPTTPEVSTVNEAVLTGVRAHRLKIRVLTVLSLALGFAAITASIIVVLAYFVLYRPKEAEVLREIDMVATAKAPTELPFDFPQTQARMAFFHSMVLMALAVAVGLLSLGTLVLATVVILNRRATFKQVSGSLAQISLQLQQLQTRRPGA